MSSLLLSLRKTLVIGFGVKQIIQDDLFSKSLIISSKTNFLIRSHSQVLGFETWGGEPSFYFLHTWIDVHTHRPLPLLMKRFLVHLDTKTLEKI